MNHKEALYARIENRNAVTWEDFERVFRLDKRTIRRFIKENIPGIKFPDPPKRKMYFTPGEALMILKEYNQP